VMIHACYIIQLSTLHEVKMVKWGSMTWHTRVGQVKGPHFTMLNWWKVINCFIDVNKLKKKLIEKKLHTLDYILSIQNIHTCTGTVMTA
jgi:hypothetical protein